MELDKICNFHNTAAQFVFVYLYLCLCLCVFVWVRCSQVVWSHSRDALTESGWQAKNAWSSETPVIAHILSSVAIICGRLALNCLDLHTQSRSQPSEEIRRDCSLYFLFLEHFIWAMPWLLLRAGPTDLRAKTGFLHKSGIPCICMGFSTHWSGAPNVAKFEGRWPKSVHNAGSNLGNGGTKWGIMSGKVPHHHHQSDPGARWTPTFPRKICMQAPSIPQFLCGIFIAYLWCFIFFGFSSCAAS